MIQLEPGRTQAGETAPTVAPPLAEVACCHDLPEIQGSIEPSAEPQLPADQVFDGRFVIRETIHRSRMATIYRAEDLLNGRREVAVMFLTLRVRLAAG